MYVLILFIPLMSSIFSGLFGRYLGYKGAGIFTSVSICITCLICWFSFIEITYFNAPNYINLWTWLDTSNFSVSFGLLFDQLTGVMLIVVTSVSCLVHIYSTEYMNGDPHLPRFMSYLSLFTFFMLILITSNNLLQLFIGWEGVGLCSYLLINFWYTRLQANKSAIKAMIVNRIGDAALAIGMFIIYYSYNSLDFNVIFSLVPYLLNDSINILGISFNTVNLIGIMLLLAAAGKSAQLGLHTWLPDAMEGPTPVSALIHAATMVTAGVFLIIRFSPLLEYSSISLVMITIFGAITAFFAATVGLVQNDIKKVIAYSTCSQLGYMLFACGISNYSVGLFHLMNHAFFKALLFLSAGSIIHAVADEQDMRRYGGLIKSLPFTYSMILIGSLSLMGFPFMTGFYSKDAILELAYGSYSTHGTFAHWLGTISAFMTAFYSIRLIYLTFLTKSNTTQNDFINAHENNICISLPLIILGFGAIFVGYIFRDAFIGLGTDWFAQSIYVKNGGNMIEAEFIPVIIKWTPVIVSLLGAGSGIILYHLFSSQLLNIKLSFRSIYIFLNNKWHFDSIYNHFIVKPILFWGHNTSYKIIDRGLIEYVGPYGLMKSISELSVKISSLQAGYVYNYGLTMFLGCTLFFILINNNVNELLLILIGYIVLLI